jgi:HK97 family phage major capsid protein
MNLSSDPVQKALGGLSEDIKAFRDDTRREVAAATQKVDTLAQSTHELAQRMIAMEQKGIRVANVAAPTPETWLQKFIDSPQLKAVREGAPTTGRVEHKVGLAEVRKNLLSTQGAAVATNQHNVAAQRSEMFGNDPRRNLALLDVLPRMQASSNTVEYHRLHSSFAHAAAYQTNESDGKAQQLVPMTLVSTPVRTIAAWVRGSRQVFADSAQLQGYIANLVGYGALQRLETELIVGAGGAGQISGLWTAGTALTTTGTQADRISSAIAQLQAAGWNPSVIVMHPTDWHEIRSERATGLEYVAGGWSSPAGPQMWGLPVVVSSSIAVNNALVLDASQTAILDRESVTVQISTEDATNFTSNMVTILAELRAGLAIFSPAAVGRVTLSP